MRAPAGFRSSDSFSLFELIVTMGIVVVIGGVAVFVLNPPEYLRQSRDSRRVQDLNTLQSLLASESYSDRRSVLGTSGTAYVSLPDTDPACGNLSLPALNPGWTYHCATAANLQNSQGSGWLPVSLSRQKTISALPVDPTNDATYHYTCFVVSNNQYLLTATLESQKRKQQFAAQDGGGSADMYEKGPNPTLWTSAYAIPHPSQWWNPSYAKRVKITFDTTGTAPSSPLANFPAAIQLNNSIISYADTQDLGQDIRFVDSDASTLLPYEIEKWDETGTSTVWVKIPQIDQNSNTDFIWMYYKNPSASDGSTPSAVWDSGYVLVNHYDETDLDGGAGDIKDSTSNMNNGQETGMAAGSQVPGRTGGALSFAGDNDSVQVPYASTLKLVNTGTIELSIKFDAVPSGTHNIISYGAYTGTETYGNGYLLNQSGTTFYLYWRSAGVNFGITSALAAGTWYHLVLANNNGAMTAYKNGSSIGTGTSSGSITANYKTWIGGSDNEWFIDGIVDEVRISNIARDPQWIAFESCNLNASCVSYASSETY